jgi:Leucine-rich repeat (LRR) protein
MNGRYQRRRERRAAEKYIYDEIDTWNLQKITAILSEAKKNKALAQRLIDYYLPILQALNSDTPHGLEHLQELPQYVEGLKNIRQSSQAEFYFKLIGFYLLKKKIPLVKEFVRNYPPDKVNALGYFNKNAAVTLLGIVLYEKLVAQAEASAEQPLPTLPDLNISILSFYADLHKKPLFIPIEAKIAARHLQNLSSLYITNLEQLKYFEPAQLFGLKYFYIRELSLKDVIPFISALPNIEEISCSDILDIEGLEQLPCPSLKILYIEVKYRHQRLPKLPEKVLDLPHLSNLQKLTINNGNIVSIDKIAHLTQLKYLYLYSGKLKNIDALAQFTQLEDLYLTDFGIEDISVLGRKNNFPKLRMLSLVNNKITNIAPLSELTAIAVLALSINKIEDISALSGSKNLRDVNLYDNKIRDISPLAGLNSELMVHAAKNKLDVCPPFELIRRVLAKDINPANKNPNKQLYILRPRQEPPHAPQIWQLLRSKDPANTELALQIAKGLGWTNDDIEPYTHIIKKWL